ncbi:MAG: 3-phosphoshikimate 1-carboxyvinyltransferase [Candidatus Hydrogenedentota bacterium]
MKLIVEGCNLRGSANIPGSKSHTIRAMAIASLAAGESVIHQPLQSADTLAAFHAYKALGAQVQVDGNAWRVQGCGGQFATPDTVIDTGNSGTTMNMVLGSTALLAQGLAVLTGDAQVRRRPSGPLAQSLNDLGATVRATRDNGCPPFVVAGRLRGGETTLAATSSQYLSSLLINSAVAPDDTAITLSVLHEAPYVHITLDWLAKQGVTVTHDDELTHFHVPGNQTYRPVNRRIPGDFSSATFFLAAGALPDNEVLCRGLDMTDTQGDKAVVDYLRQMGAAVAVEEAGVHVAARRLTGIEIDLNATPDALPMMAVVGCFAHGETRLVNVAHARDKETDRLTVMREELTKLGADIVERPDGLVIREHGMHAGEVDGRGDHRVVMALAIAGTLLNGTTTIHGYEAVEITFPNFLEVLRGLGANVRLAV